MSRQPTVSDVAVAAGVSRQTVSNVLNSPEIVREVTRERVLRVIHDLGYRPHSAARQLRTRKSSALGVRLDPVLNGISGGVLDRFLHALTERATARGHSILLFTATDPLDEIEQYRRLLDGAAVDAFVLTSTLYDDPRIAWLLGEKASFVTFGRPWGASDMNDPRYRWVDVDGRRGVADATEGLFDRGASRVAYLGWPAHSGAGEERRWGWRQATESAHPDHTAAEIDARELVCEDDVHKASDAVREFLATGTEFDAMICASDTLALGALMVLGSSVPVIGYDNTSVAEAVRFSSIEQPLEDVATAALDLLGIRDVTRAGDGDTGADPFHRLLAPRTVWRDQHPTGV